jgi:hypothetical protein
MDVAILPEIVFDQARKYTEGFREPSKYVMGFSSRTPLETGLQVFLKDVDNFQSRISGNHIYRYQHVCKVDGREIPIYGSSVVGEAEEREITFSSAQVDKKVAAIADPMSGTPTQPEIKNESGLKDALRKELGEVVEKIDLRPTLYYYYDISHKQEGKWRLVWVTDIPTKQFEHIEGKDFLSKLADYIVDAKSGEIVDKLSHVRS